jgi:putative DNA primase/helicase
MQSQPDKVSRRFLQEWMGYQLIHSVKQQKFVIMYGHGADGKSVWCLVCRLVVGPDNVTAVGLEAFDPKRTFPLAVMDGKLANIVEEIGELDKAAEGLIKQIVGGSPVLIERKHRGPITTVLSARLTFATNTWPRFSDRSDGIWRRVSVIKFENQILDESKQNKNLIDADWWINSGDLPGILNWAIAGLKRLEARGHFTESEKSKDAKGEFRVDANPARQYLLDHCAYGAALLVPTRPRHCTLIQAGGPCSRAF